MKKISHNKLSVSLSTKFFSKMCAQVKKPQMIPCQSHHFKLPKIMSANVAFYEFSAFCASEV